MVSQHKVVIGLGIITLEPYERPDADLERLIHAMANMLAPLIKTMRKRQQVLTHLHLDLTLDDGVEVRETLQPAEPTIDEEQVLSLIRLRLDGVALSAGVIEMKIEVDACRLKVQQRDLFTAPARDLTAARRALARLRAEFGPGTVQRACLQEGHLPEARFAWRPFEQLEPPAATTATTGNDVVEPGPLVRRYLDRARPLAGARGDQHPSGLRMDPEDGAIEEWIGPHIVSGGWWQRRVTRHYYYARTESGRWLWLYLDQRRQRWFLQGEVQ